MNVCASPRVKRASCAAAEGARPEGVCSVRVEANSCFLNEVGETVEANTSSDTAATAAPLLHPAFFPLPTFARACRELQAGWSCCSWVFSFCMWLLSPRDCSGATTWKRPGTAWRAAEPNSRGTQVSSGSAVDPTSHSARRVCAFTCVCRWMGFKTKLFYPRFMSSH